ncbi:MAG TPA: hypothetical protein VFB37_09945 [Steroidobacteraceae bacterium]|nr:hypothetical protein [Steroidobacteraceae bacterium]
MSLHALIAEPADLAPPRAVITLAPTRTRPRFLTLKAVGDTLIAILQVRERAGLRTVLFSQAPLRQCRLDTRTPDPCLWMQSAALELAPEEAERLVRWGARADVHLATENTR